MSGTANSRGSLAHFSASWMIASITGWNERWPSITAESIAKALKLPLITDRAALALLVAKTALAEGHAVSVFLAGDAVQLLREPVLDNLAGLGTGRLREHFDAIAKAGGKFYLSGGSSKARGVTDADLTGKPAEFATPDVLLRLSLAHDRMFTY